tara:strand:- start:84 stop:185 length:102 start_codon:yes stop_codon:yes gene_type:complete
MGEILKVAGYKTRVNRLGGYYRREPPGRLRMNP